MNIQKYARVLALSAFIMAGLNGCAAAIVGGAAAGTDSALDRRTTGAQADDEVMEVRVKNTALTYLNQNNASTGYTPKLSVVSYNRHILLLGQVATPGEKAFVEQVARSEKSVEGVYNYIDVAPQERTFGAVSADTWSTSKVRTSLLGIKGVYPGRVKIVTYNKVTYILGILTAVEQAAVTEKVSTTPGVQKVITLYQNYVAPVATTSTATTNSAATTTTPTAADQSKQ